MGAVVCLSRSVVATLIGALLLSCAARADTSAPRKRESFVVFEKGQLPIILSAPHGGAKAIPDVPKREGRGVRQFSALQDIGTRQLTERLAKAIEAKCGKRPYFVLAEFHRRYIDANRPASRAYESAAAKPVYDAYHAALAKARREVTKRFGRGLLLDIHGQGAEPKTIFRGTQNGKTVTHLVKRFGREALVDESSLFGELAKQGLHVVPSVDSDDREDRRYNGGFIVRTYGSAKGGTVDAIQLELGRELRSPKSDTAEKLAEAILAFTKKHLPRNELERSARSAATTSSRP